MRPLPWFAVLLLASAVSCSGDRRLDPPIVLERATFTVVGQSSKEAGLWIVFPGGLDIPSLFDSSEIGSSNVGATFYADASLDSDFARIASRLADAVDGSMCVGTCGGACDFECGKESDFFEAWPSLVTNARIERMQLHLDAFRRADVSVDGRDAEYTFTLLVIGRPR